LGRAPDIDGRSRRDRTLARALTFPVPAARIVHAKPNALMPTSDSSGAAAPGPFADPLSDHPRPGSAPHGFFGHPRGLSVLFFTEMWERFSYYGMRAFLILYMVHVLGFDDRHAGSMYGTYTASAWAAAIVGGIIADKWLGQYKSVLIGGIIIALGHFTLAFHPLPFFYTGLGLIVIGTGLLKPNVSGIVGSLYETDDA